MTGMATDIFVATETTERPLFCVVIAARLNTDINKTPRKRVPANHGLEGTTEISLSPRKLKNPTAQAIK